MTGSPGRGGCQAMVATVPPEPSVRAMLSLPSATVPVTSRGEWQLEARSDIAQHHVVDALAQPQDATLVARHGGLSGVAVNHGARQRGDAVADAGEVLDGGVVTDPGD